MATGITGGMEELDAMIERARGLFEGDDFPRAAAASVDTWLRSKLAQGLDPNTGEAWAKTKDGERPLKTAPSRPEVRLAGSNVIVSLKGYYVFQHFPTRGRVARRVIPQGQMPPELGTAIRLGLVAPFEAKTKEGKRGWAATQRRKGA